LKSLSVRARQYLSGGSSMLPLWRRSRGLGHPWRRQAGTPLEMPDPDHCRPAKVTGIAEAHAYPHVPNVRPGALPLYLRPGAAPGQLGRGRHPPPRTIACG
jgi:hypothetical protein